MNKGDSYNPVDPTEETPKIFITNLSASVPQEELKRDLEPLFEKYGRIVHLNVKKNKNGLYSFAFLEFEKVDEALKAIQELDQMEFHGKVMRVRQDRQMDGCFHCKKTGHYARECPYKEDKDNRSKGQNYKGGNGYRRKDDRDDYYHHRRHGRSRSRSRSHRRRRSYSRSRSYSPRQRDPYYRSRRHEPKRYQRSRSRSYSHDRYHDRKRYRKHRSPSRSYS